MTSQTDHHTEDTQFDELANRDEAEAVAAQRQETEDLVIYAVEILAVLAIIAVIVFGK